MPAPTTDDPTDIRRKRLLFRSWHRGTREADLILGSFAERISPGSTTAQLDRFEALLEVPDAELFDWIAGRAAPPPEHDTRRDPPAARLPVPPRRDVTMTASPKLPLRPWGRRGSG